MSKKPERVSELMKRIDEAISDNRGITVSPRQLRAWLVMLARYAKGEHTDFCEDCEAKRVAGEIIDYVKSTERRA